MVCSGTSCSRPVTSLTTCVHSPPCVPPPTATSRFTGFVVGVEELEDLPDPEGDALVDRSEDVPALVSQGEAGDHAAGVVVEDRRAFAREVGQQEQSVRPRRNGSGLLRPASRTARRRRGPAPIR